MNCLVLLREHVPHLAFLGRKLVIASHRTGEDQIVMRARNHPETSISRTSTGLCFVLLIGRESIKEG